MLYEIITLNTVIFGPAKMAGPLEIWCKSVPDGGRFLGAWATDIGQLNQVILLRAFETQGQMNAAREPLRGSADPFGCGEHIVDYTVETFEMFDFLPEIAAEEVGPVFEFRTYQTKPNGLFETREKWREFTPRRREYSPLIAAMYGIDGPPRLTQIWAYKSLAERSSVRARVVADDVWPPKGGPAWLTPNMTSQIAMPLAFSPLR